MKKLVAMILMTAMLVGVSITAFATSVTVPGSLEDDIKVYATYEAHDPESPVYEVDIYWGVMNFTYYASGAEDSGVAGVWSATGNNIGIENNSLVGVDASFTYVPLTDYESVIGTFTSDSISLTAPASDLESSTGYVSLSLSGILEDENAVTTQIGSVTVTLTTQ